jgi:threonine dehydratase
MPLDPEVRTTRAPGPIAPVTGARPARSGTRSETAWPITLDDVHAAERRIRPFLTPTPLRRYPTLDAAVGHDIAVWVKHENFQPTNSFKVRNGLALVSALRPDQRARGVVAATRGNHGLGIAYAGALLACPVTVCVPLGNNPEKNEAMAALGARLIERGRDYDDALAVAHEVSARDGLHLAHSTNDPQVLAGSGTLGLELLQQQPDLEALVLAVGGGSQAVGVLTVVRALRPDLPVYGVQARGAPAIHDSWHAGRALTHDRADTFADGLATRHAYELTFPALRSGLAGFVTATDGEIAAALRLLLRTTHTLVEGAGATGTAGLLGLRDALAGRRVGVVLSGGNIDAGTLRRVVTEAL